MCSQSYSAFCVKTLPWNGNASQPHYSLFVREGDILFSRIDIRNGAIGFVRGDLDGAVVTRDFPVFRLYQPTDIARRFLRYYGPTMNAFEAADKNDRAGNLQTELEGLFNRQNKSTNNNATSIPATFLRVTVVPG
jgi:hypothetical protein